MDKKTEDLFGLIFKGVMENVLDESFKTVTPEEWLKKANASTGDIKKEDNTPTEQNLDEQEIRRQLRQRVWDSIEYKDNYNDTQLFNKIDRIVDYLYSGKHPQQ